MRFLVMILIFFMSQNTIAAGENFNEMIGELSKQETRLHKKLLRSLQNTKIAVAYNERWEQIRGTEAISDNSMSVRLVQVTK